MAFNYAAAKAAGYTDKEIQDYLFKGVRPVQQAAPVAQQPASQPQGNYFQRAAGNVIPDVLENIKGLLNLPQFAAQSNIKAAQPKPFNLSDQAQNAALSVAVPGMGSNPVFQDVVKGQAQATKQTVLHPVQSFEERPVSTVLNLLPVLQMFKALGVGESLKGFQTSTQAGINKPKVGGAPASRPTRVAAVTQEAQDLGINKGSAINRTKIIDKQYGDLQQQIDNLLPTIKAKYEAPIAKQTILERIQTDGNIGHYFPVDNTAPAYAKAVNTLLQPLLKKSKAGLLSAQDIDQLKFDPRLKRAVANEAAGKALSVSDQVGADVYRALNSLLEDLSPDVRALRSQQSTLNKISTDLFGQSADQVLSTPFGLRANVTRPIQAPTSGAVNIAGGVGTALDDLVGNNAGIASASQAIVNTGRKPLEVKKKPATDTGQLSSAAAGPSGGGSAAPLLSSDGQWQWDSTVNKTWADGSKGDWVPAGQAGGDQEAGGISREQFNQLAMADLMASGGKNISKIVAIANLVAPKKTLTADQQNKVSALNSARQIVTQLQQNYNQAVAEGQAGSPVTGFVSQAQGMAVGGNQATIYNNLRKGTLAPVIRALGEKGALSEGDVERAISLLPSPGMNPEAAAKQFQQVFAIIDGAIDKQAPTEQSGGGDTLDMMSGLGVGLSN